MRHPLDEIRIPAPMVRVLSRLAEDPEAERCAPADLAHRHASLLYDMAPALLAARFPAPPNEPLEDHALMRELEYVSTPFELVPVSWNGGDGLHYDWVVYAPELDLSDFPMVSFAPTDEWGAMWLGDHTAEGLAHLLVGQRKGRHTFGHEDPHDGEQWRSLVALLGHAPDPDDPRISEGARSERACVPPIPDGYRWEDGPDGVGVLAPKDLFGDVDFAELPGDPGLLDREAARLALAGKHAGALVLLKNLRSWSPTDLAVVERMREAYLALGRPMHARRAQHWLTRRRARLA